MHSKEYEKLLFTDDFMFCKILSTDVNLCKKILELILGKKIHKIVCVQEQKPIKITSNGKGVRLDVYLEDDQDVVYNIEMQTRIMKDLAKRARYYQGMIDLNIIQEGKRYSELKNSFIIFICLDDPFGENMPIYTFNNRCVENTNVVLNDGATKVFVNPNGMCDNIDEEMNAFLRYLKTGVVSSCLTSEIEAKVCEARELEEWEREYMSLCLHDQDVKEEGAIEKAKKVALNLRDIGMTDAEIAKVVEMTETELEEMLKE